MSTVASRIDRPKTSPTYPNGPERAARGPSDAALVPAAADDARRVTGMQALDPRRHQDSRRRAGSKPRHPRARRDLRPRQAAARVADRGRGPMPAGRSCSSAIATCTGFGRDDVPIAIGRGLDRMPPPTDPSSGTIVASAWHGRLGRRDGDSARCATHSIVEASLARLQVSHRGRQGGRPRTCRVSLTPPCGRGLLRRGRRGVEPGAGTFDPRRTLPRRGLQPSSNRMRTGKPQREETPWRTDGAG